MASRNRDDSSLKRALIAKRLRASESELIDGEPIAIVGMACRFPGASTPEDFWRLLAEGRDAITEVPAQRWALDEHYDPDPAAPGRMYTRWGGFIDEVDRFDADFFRISPREAVAMDPQQRVLLEVGWEALEAAGVVPDRLAATPTGVFIGISNPDYAHLLSRSCDVGRLDPYVLTGNSSSVACGRISYLLGLRGPSVAVDTACSSSLVSVHLACQSLRSRECNLALAGGVQLLLAPETTTLFCKGRGLSPDGRCRTFDARAEGFVRGEGCGVLVLRRLSDAIQAGDEVLAVIRGSALNQDGRSAGLTAPNATAQAALLRDALRNAGVDPAQITYVEAHGTGTPLGDPIEMEALATVVGAASPGSDACAVGSVKTNIGHLEAAAGVAGLIKTTLALRHETIPPHLNFEQLNPHIRLDDTRLFVPTEPVPWRSNGSPRRAGVSSFGFSGTNAHLVLEEAPPLLAARREASAAGRRPACLLPLSARTREGLDLSARRLLDALPDAADGATPALHDLCYTASVRRSHHDHRLALVAGSVPELREQLASYLEGEPPPRMSVGEAPRATSPGLAFVFSGYESQWPGMGAQLLETEPVFRSVIESCDELVREHGGWSLLEELGRDEGGSRIDQIEIGQTAVFALQVGLAALWRSWGVEPDAVIGHSMGEVAAAHVAGVTTLDEAVRIICHRSRLGSRLRGRGGMLGVHLSLEEAGEALVGFEDRVGVAVENNATSTVLSGDTDALSEIAAALEGREVFTRWLRVPAPGHCPQVEALLPEFEAAVGEIAPKHSAIRFFSTVTGEVLDGSSLDFGYWCRNAREPVRFWTALAGMIGDGFDRFLELSPHPTLYSAIDGALRQLERDGAVYYSLRREAPECATLLENLGGLYTAGVPIDWSGLHPDGGRLAPLPTYPWAGQRFWYDELIASAPAAARAGGEPGHPLLGRSLELATESGTRCWETELSTGRFRYLADHRSGDTVVLPASAFIEMALAAARETFGEGPHGLEDLHLDRAFLLPADGTSRPLQLMLRPESQGAASLRFFSGERSEEDGTRRWTQCATARLRAGGREPAGDPTARLESLRERCPEVLPAEDFYERMRRSGFDYGPAFRGVREIFHRDGEALGRLASDDSFARGADRYHVHPALLDAALQLVAAAVAAREPAADGLYVPVSLRRLVLRGEPRGELWSHATLVETQEQQAGCIEADVRVLDAAGQVLVEATGLRCRSLEATRPETLDDWLFGLEWRETPLAEAVPDAAAEVDAGEWLILADADERGVGARLCEKLSEAGARCVVARTGAASARLAADAYQVDPSDPDALRELVAEAFSAARPPRGVVHLWSLDLAEPAGADLSSLRRAGEIACTSVLHCVQALAWSGWREHPRLWLVTRGAHSVGGPESGLSLAQAPLLGLGRVVASEHPELRCTRVDLDFECLETDAGALFEECWRPDAESEVALRGGLRLSQRLVRGADARDGDDEAGVELRPAEGRPFRLEVDRPGDLAGLTLHETARRAPGPGEVEIAVGYAGLKFSDVLIALGTMPVLSESGGLPIGGECAGLVCAVGEGVADFAVGDEVIAAAPFALGSFVTAPASLVVHKPAGLEPADAAGIPSVFMTAHYALDHLARLAPGDKLLIHSAAGGVGLAAVQLARRVGAEIFATAGSPEKRDYLRSLGIEHVMDSRSLDFADEVMRVTGGRGVDVVLNSLSGEGIRRNLEILAPYGRFVEIGIRDIYADTKIGLRPFRNSLSYHSVDLASMMYERPELWVSLLREVLEGFERGELAPLPRRIFPISQAVEAFRHMARARHIGKIVLAIEDPDVRIAPRSDRRISVSADASYLISGGLGGVGLRMADWLVGQGARHLVLLGRSGASRPGAREAVERLRAAGAEVIVARADVADPQDVAAVLDKLHGSLPPLRGVMHAAVALDDRLLIRQDRASMESVLAAKMLGAWNLHQATLGEPLEFFVLFSSVAALLGNPGQGNYAAGNAFLDALAHHRRAIGLPGLSVDWGPWAEVGGASLLGLEEQFAAAGMACIPPDRGCEALAALLAGRATQAAVLSLDVRRWLEFQPAASELPLLSDLVVEHGRQARPRRRRGRLLKELLALDPGPARVHLLETHVRKEFGRVLGFDPAQLDPRKPLADMGIDSLVAVELRNCLEESLGVTLGTTIIFSHPTIESLLPELARRASLELLPEGPAGAEGAEPSQAAGGDATERGRRQRQARARRRRVRREAEVTT